MYGQVNKSLQWGLCVSILFVPSSVFGQPAPEPAKLFEEGKERMNTGDYVNGCRLLQESYDLEPKFGRLYTLALCRDREGRSATAWGLYKDYLTAIAELEGEARESHAKRASDAAERVRALDATVPRLKLVWRGKIPENIDVRLDGRDALPKLNTDWPLDPGEHVIIVRGNGEAEEPRTLKLENGQPTVEVDLTPPEKPPAKVEAPPPEPKVVPPPEIKPTIQKDKQTGVLSQRTLGLMWFGVAGGGVVAAAILGIKAASMKSDIEKGCPNLVCSKDGSPLLDEGYAWGNAATITLGLSGALAVVGAVEMWGRGTPKKPVAQKLNVQIGAGPRDGFVMVEGRF